MPRKKTTPNETGTVADASTPAAPPAKRIRKPLSEPVKKAAVRKGVRAARGNFAAKAVHDSELQPKLAEKVTNSSVAVAPPPELDLEEAVSEHEQIALLAYEFWRARGCQGGSPEEDWLRAEQEYRRRREAQLNGR